MMRPRWEREGMYNVDHDLYEGQDLLRIRADACVQTETVCTACGLHKCFNKCVGLGARLSKLLRAMTHVTDQTKTLKEMS